MIRFKTDEKWALLRGHKSAYGEKYAISNHGRLVKFRKDIAEGSLLKGSLQEGYPIWRTRINGIHKHALLHRLVAKYFLPKPQKAETVVIHSNYKKTDNRFYNLQWATIKEAAAHAQGNPSVKKAKRLRRETGNAGNAKLSLADVKIIKQLIRQNKTLKEIAAEYNVSDMQIYRIKTGENWANVK
jgi:HNH endonuclease